MCVVFDRSSDHFCGVGFLMRYASPIHVHVSAQARGTSRNVTSLMQMAAKCKIYQ